MNLLKMPFTIQPLDRHWRLRYVRPSRMTVHGWDPGSEWVSPTSLSFATETITARKYRKPLKINSDIVISPDTLIATIEGQWNELVLELHDEEVLVDSGTEVGFRLVPLGKNVVAELEVKTWPIIPGVTSPKLKEF